MSHQGTDRVTIGKFEGELWRDLPEWYLNSQANWGRECQGELDRRESERELELGPLERYLTQFKRTLAKTAHPDAGGSNEEMQRVNQCHELLMKLVADYKQQGLIKKP
jgi:hypothetical protein